MNARFSISCVFRVTVVGCISLYQCCNAPFFLRSKVRGIRLDRISVRFRFSRCLVSLSHACDIVNRLIGNRIEPRADAKPSIHSIVYHWESNAPRKATVTPYSWITSLFKHTLNNITSTRQDVTPGLIPLVLFWIHQGRNTCRMLDGFLNRKVVTIDALVALDVGCG